jgi:hypothetical protein
MLPVLVPATREESLASLALLAERVPHEEVVMHDDLDYARELQRRWASGGFIIVEHDIVPWPGALRELDECPHEWCRFPYPIGGSLAGTLGCVKFGSKLTARMEYTALANWRWLDGVVLEMLGGFERCHAHAPPVAHVGHPYPLALTPRRTRTASSMRR